jgi:DNA processing protein
MTAAPPALQLSDAQRVAWLRLIRSDNVGPVTFRELLNHFGSATAAIDAMPDLSERAGRRIRICSEADAESEMAALSDFGGRLIAMGEAEYPRWLSAVDGAPPLLAVHGNTACLSAPIVSVVGSRNASVAGRKFAMQISHALGEVGYVVASGLARGIDAAAHEGALAAGTIAVFAGGLDRPYPSENVRLAGRIVEAGGAHLSEMPMGWEPRARDFPRRNRIISGLALGVVVVEAAQRSGSLITARLAGEQGRAVFAVPGSPLDPRAAGANALIKDGATVVTEVADILAELQPMLGKETPAVALSEPPVEPPSEPDDDDRTTILSALGPTPVGIDEVIRFTKLRPAVVHLLLIELDLAGRLERHPGQRVSLIS